MHHRLTIPLEPAQARLAVSVLDWADDTPGYDYDRAADAETVSEVYERLSEQTRAGRVPSLCRWHWQVTVEALEAALWSVELLHEHFRIGELLQLLADRSATAPRTQASAHA